MKLGEDLNDLDSVWHIDTLGVVLRLTLAVILGGAIGFEREWKKRAAGFRTHILVCLAAACLMVLSIYGFEDFYSDPANWTEDSGGDPNLLADPARLAAQVISGIGFLGAGAILQKNESIIGLTTAATVWVVAAVGLCVGAGFYYCAVLLTVMSLLTLTGLKYVEGWFRIKKQQSEK